MNGMSSGAVAGSTDAQKQTVLGELLARLSLAAQETADIANDLHRQADRVFGPVPSDPSPGENANQAAIPTVQELSMALDRLNFRISHLRAGAIRLRPIA